MLTEDCELEESTSCDCPKESETLGHSTSLASQSSVIQTFASSIDSNSIDDTGEKKLGTSSSLTDINLQEIAMLERLSQDTKVIVKSQQRGERDLTVEEKLEALKTLYRSTPSRFLSRFGKFLVADDAKCFEKLSEEDDYDAAFQLKEIKKLWNKGSQEKRLKNRRYEALKKLVETTDYFSEEEMQRRNPILYEQLIGKFHTEEEREAFLHQSWKSASGSGTSAMPLTDMFLAHLQRNSDGSSCRRMAQETQLDEEDEADAEYDSDDDDYDMDSPEEGHSKSKGGKSPRRNVSMEGPREEIDDDEKELLKEEFFTTMYRSFLNGKDEDFDYSTVDDNPEYDCGENLDNDEEEKYFDEEEPCQVSEPSSDLDDLFKPPVRSSEIESKIEKLSVTNEDSHKNETSKEIAMSEDEDELDAYMKEIEKQLQK